MGSIGPAKPGWIHTFRQLDGVEVVAYCEDSDTARLDEASEHQPEANVYTSVDDLIEKQDFDFAFIALPANEIPGVGIKLAEAGKHFFMEKQFARRADDLAEMVRAVRKAGVTVMPGYPHRFNPVMQDLKRMIDEGILGKPLDLEVRMVTGQVRPGGRDPGGFLYTNKEEGGGIQHMLGGHQLEVMRFLMGCEVKSVVAMNGRPVGYIDEPLEDISIAAFEFENGAYGSMHAGYLQRVKVGYDTSLIYRGLEGEANWTPMGSPYLEVKSASVEWAGSPVRRFEYEFASGLPGYASDVWTAQWIQGYVDALREGKEAPLTVEDGLHTLQLIDAIYESGRTGQRVEVQYGV
jgi:predicted dehydrogenase